MSNYYVAKDGEKVSKEYDDYVKAQQRRAILELRTPAEDKSELTVERT